MEKEDEQTLNSIKNFENINVYYQNKRLCSALVEGIKETDTEYFCIINADGSINQIILMI